MRITSKKSHSLSWLVLLLLPVFLAGCWDRQEIEERVSVAAIGVDKVKKENTSLFRVTVQIPIPNQIASGGGAGGGGKGGKDAVQVMSSTGITVGDAVNNLQKRLNRQLFYGHTRIIAFGEEIARSGVSSIVDGLRRQPQIRRLLWPIVVKGEALDFLKVNPKLEQIPMVFLMSMIESGIKMERTPDLTLGNFYIALSNTGEQPCLNYVESKGNDVKVKGLAVFREDRMVGTLDTKETWTWLQLAQDKYGGNVTFSLDGKKDHMVTFHPRVIKRKMQFSQQNGKIAARIQVELEGDVTEATFPADFSKQSTIEDFQHKTAEVYEKQAQEMIRKVQKKYKSDVLGLGRSVRAFHYDIWKNVDWDKEFPNIKIDVTYNVKMRRTGMEMG